jgi:aminobenzoyl-glutamate transport protein
VEPALEGKGMRHAGLAVLAVLAFIAVLTLPPGAPLRNPETRDIIGDSPFMTSLIVMISAAFLAAGIAYGRAVGTVKGADDVLGMIAKSWASLVGLIFLFLLIAQFIAYFDFSNMAQVAAVSLGDILEELDLGDLWLLLGVLRSGRL